MTDTRPKQVEIIPAILPKSLKDLTEHMEMVAPSTKFIQVDVVDGIFAKHKTWPYHDEVTFTKIVNEEHGLPFWDEIDFEFDLMIDHPERTVLNFVRAGALRLVLHAKSEGVIDAFRMLLETREEGGTYTIQIGIGIMPEAQPEILEPFESQFDYVQVMGIDHVGKQGEPFDEHALFLVERIRRRYPELTIQVDGGVTMENVKALARAGANRLVVGHAIFEEREPLGALEALRVEANQ